MLIVAMWNDIQMTLGRGQKGLCIKESHGTKCPSSGFVYNPGGKDVVLTGNLSPLSPLILIQDVGIRSCSGKSGGLEPRFM